MSLEATRRRRRILQAGFFVLQSGAQITGMFSNKFQKQLKEENQGVVYDVSENYTLVFM